MLVSKEDLEVLKEGMIVSKENTLRGYKERYKRYFQKNYLGVNYMRRLPLGM